MLSGKNFFLKRLAGPRKTGFTLTEILIAIVILGVAVAIAFPGFMASKEKAEARQAVAYLMLIRAAEKDHHLKNAGTYVALANATEIRDTLNVKATTGSYDFKVDVAGAGFNATATHRASGQKIILDHAGSFAGDSPYVPD